MLTGGGPVGVLDEVPWRPGPRGADGGAAVIGEAALTLRGPFGAKFVWICAGCGGWPTLVSLLGWTDGPVSVAGVLGAEFGAETRSICPLACRDGPRGATGVECSGCLVRVGDGKDGVPGGGAVKFRPLLLPPGPFLGPVGGSAGAFSRP